MLALLSGSFLFGALNVFVYFNLPAEDLSLVVVQRQKDTTARSHARLFYNNQQQQQPRKTTMATAATADRDSTGGVGVGGDVLVVATRFHLGKAAVPPSPEDLRAKLQGFARFCSDSCCASSCRAATTTAASDAAAAAATASTVVGVIAVDAEERIAGYDLVAQVRQAVRAVQEAQRQQQDDTSRAAVAVPSPPQLHVLPVQPWGQFAPALNALVSWAAAFYSEKKNNNNSQRILFCSAETTASAAAVAALRRHLTDDTAVAGLVLPGHDFHSGKNRNNEAVEVPLTGRTTPWNTLALWDVRKLARTGFQLVSEGIVNDSEQQNMAGVEEVVAIAVLQKLLGAEQAKAKLVQMQDGKSGVVWDQTFGGDPARQQWHEQKMQSKLSRADRQLQLLTGAGGTVHHVVSE